MARYISPVSQVEDANGVPIVGAKKFFFETGTVTPKTIYSDSELTLTRANPVISDASGRYAEDVFLDGLYKEEQQDNSGTATGYDGVTLWTVDPIGDTTTGQFEIWVSSDTYDIPDIVLGSDDEYYRSLTDGNQGNDPTTSAANWELLSFGRVWNTNVTYGLGDSAYGSDGFLYISIASSNLANNPTTDSTKWRDASRNNQYAVATGTADVITATFSPVIPAWVDGIEFTLRASGANTIAGVTVNPDGIGAKTAKREGNQALLVGDIFGAGHETQWKYNLSNDVVELLNPASPGVGTVQTTSYAAGSVDQAAIGALAVGQGELKTTTGTVSDAGAGPGALYTLPGGQYGFYPETQYTKTGGTPVDPRAMIYYDPTGALTNTYTAFIYLDADNGGGDGAISAQQRYIQASPPYFDANGELIGRYIFAKIDNNSGQVVGVYNAQEAPWHYNGPTDIRGKLGSDGKKYRERKDMGSMPFTHAQAKGDPIKMQEYYAAFGEAPTIIEEITQSIKDADMALIPRPMEPTADTIVVMLDPISDLNHQLCDMSAHDEFSINELLHSGLITIDTDPLTRAGPPGVPVHGFRWK